MHIQSVNTNTNTQAQGITNIHPKVTTSDLKTQVETISIADQSKNAADNEHVISAVQKVQEYIAPFNSNIEFSINKDTEQIVIRVVDKQTKEIIRQIPSEEMIEIAKALDKIKGLLIKQSA